MSGYKPDLTSNSTLSENYSNYTSPTGSIVISGSVANGNTANFSVAIGFTRANTKGDIYIYNAATGNKTILKGNRFSTFENVYQFVSTEAVSRLVSYTSSSVTVTVSVFNGTGGSINLTSQTLTVALALYDAPIGNI